MCGCDECDDRDLASVRDAVADLGPLVAELREQFEENERPHVYWTAGLVAGRLAAVSRRIDCFAESEVRKAADAYLRGDGARFVELCELVGYLPPMLWQVGPANVVSRIPEDATHVRIPDADAWALVEFYFQPDASNPVPTSFPAVVRLTRKGA